MRITHRFFLFFFFGASGFTSLSLFSVLFVNTEVAGSSFSSALVSSYSWVAWLGSSLNP
jgi:hypothetical protein